MKIKKQTGYFLLSNGSYFYGTLLSLFSLPIRISISNFIIEKVFTIRRLDNSESQYINVLCIVKNEKDLPEVWKMYLKQLKKLS